MRKTYKYRLLANKPTFSRASEWMLLCQRLYNIALEQRIYIYRYNRETISCYAQSKQLPELKEAFPEYQLVGAQVLQDVIQRLDKAYQAFFRRIKNGDRKAGFPRFKSRDRYDSFTLTQAMWKLNGKYLIIRNVGRFKLRLSRPIEGNIKTVTIHRAATCNWYVCFSCDKVLERELAPSVKTIGIDVGIKSFCVDSDGHSEFNPAYFRHTEKQLKIRQRILCRRIINSNGRKDARILVAKAHEKVVNQRTDFLHKVANHYITNYGVIYIENLNISGMVKNHHLAKSISDASWSKFFELLSYKAEEAGRKVVKVPRFEPTSKTCSQCGAINHELTLADRQWVCRSCATSHDRDYNAAKNIHRVGQTLQEQTYGSVQSVS
jgi:putative transposase